MTTGIRFFALKSKKEKVYWIEVRTIFNVKTTITTTTTKCMEEDLIVLGTTKQAAAP